MPSDEDLNAAISGNGFFLFKKSPECLPDRASKDCYVVFRESFTRCGLHKIGMDQVHACENLGSRLADDVDLMSLESTCNELHAD